jgi:hypothetical protein
MIGYGDYQDCFLTTGTNLNRVDNSRRRELIRIGLIVRGKTL